MSKTPPPHDPGLQPSQSPGLSPGRWFKAGGWKALAGAALGASALAAYSYFIGCRTGTCLLTSDVRSATLFGGLFGLVAGWPVPPEKQAVRVKR